MEEKLNGIAKHDYKTTATAEEFLTALRVKDEYFEVPGLKHPIKVRGLGASEREAVRLAATDTRTGKVDNALFQVLAVKACITEPKMSVEHIVALKEVGYGTLDFIFNRIWKLSGVGLNEEELKNVSRATSNAETSSLSPVI